MRVLLMVFAARILFTPQLCFTQGRNVPWAGFLSLTICFTVCTGDTFFFPLPSALYYSCRVAVGGGGGLFFGFFSLSFSFSCRCEYAIRSATRLWVRLDVLFVVHLFLLFFSSPDLGLRECQRAVCASPVPSKLPPYTPVCSAYRTVHIKNLWPLTTFRLACGRTGPVDGSRRSRYVSAHCHTTNHDRRHGVIYGTTDGCLFAPGRSESASAGWGGFAELSECIVSYILYVCMYVRAYQV